MLSIFAFVGAANIVTGTTRNLWQAAKTWWNTRTHNSLRMITSNKCVAGYHMGYLEKSPELVYNAIHDLLEMYQNKKIKPQIDSVWALEDVSVKIMFLPCRFVSNCFKDDLANNVLVHRNLFRV